jgi:hypothetical protein
MRWRGVVGQWHVHAHNIASRAQFAHIGHRLQRRLDAVRDPGTVPVENTVDLERVEPACDYPAGATEPENAHGTAGQVIDALPGGLDHPPLTATCSFVVPEGVPHQDEHRHDRPRGDTSCIGTGSVTTGIPSSPANSTSMESMELYVPPR